MLLQCSSTVLIRLKYVRIGKAFDVNLIQMKKQLVVALGISWFCRRKKYFIYRKKKIATYCFRIWLLKKENGGRRMRFCVKKLKTRVCRWGSSRLAGNQFKLAMTKLQAMNRSKIYVMFLETK